MKKNKESVKDNQRDQGTSNILPKDIVKSKKRINCEIRNKDRIKQKKRKKIRNRAWVLFWSLHKFNVKDRVHGLDIERSLHLAPNVGPERDSVRFLIFSDLK